MAELCQTVSKTVTLYSSHRGVGYCLGECDTDTVTQEVCVTGNSAATTSQNKLDEAIQQWRQITHLKNSWIPYNWYTYRYSVMANGALGKPSEELWK